MSAQTYENVAQRRATTNVQYANVDEFYRTYDNQLLTEIEALVRAQSDRYQPGEDRERFLIRFHSTVALTYAFEYVFGNIFRSQILALQELNRRSVPVDDLKRFYDMGVVANPVFYQTYSFNQWLAFLRTCLLITLSYHRKSGQRLSLQNRPRYKCSGQEFLLLQSG